MGKKTNFLIVLLLAKVFLLSGQVKFVNEFLNIGVGARSLAMSGSLTASTQDVFSIYWNPANLSEIDAPMQLGAMHTNWFGGIANYDFIGISRQLHSEKRAQLGLSMIRMGIDNIPNTLNLVGPDGSIDFDRVTNFSAADYGFLGSYGQRLSENLSMGGSVKVIHRTIGTFGSSWGFGADLAITLKKGHFTFALMGRDITTTFNAWSFNLTNEEKNVFLSTGNDVPISSTEVTLPRLVWGTSYSRSWGKISFVGEADLNISGDGRKSAIISGSRFIIDPSLGFELGYASRVYLRGGLGNLQRSLNSQNSDTETFDFQPNIGLGLRLGRLHIDYALANVGNVSGVLVSHIFSAFISFADSRKPGEE